MVNAHKGWGTQMAKPRALATQRLCPTTLRVTCTQWATTGAPDAFRAATSAHRGSSTLGALRHSAVVRLRPRDPVRSGQRLGTEQGTWGSRTRKHGEASCGRPINRGVWTAKTVKRPPQQPTQPQHANYSAPLTRKRHTMPHLAQPKHTNH